MEYTIENNFIKLTVTDEGGSMRSVIYKPTGEERLWQGGEFWQSQDVVIFPILGHAGAYTVNGKTYQTKSHGVVRYAKLKLYKQTKTSLTLTLSSSEETLAVYPFAFEFAITYRLIEKGFQVTYYVAAKEGVIPFYVGGHPGMKAPNGEVEIELLQPENAVMYPLETDGSVMLNDLNLLVLDKPTFAKYKTLQLGNLTGGMMRAITTDGYVYTYQSDCPVWAFWSNEKGGDYVCVEPWWGINDFASAPRELTLKPFINFADEDGKEFSYTLEIENINSH